MTEPENKEETQEPSDFQKSVAESLLWVVDMMNNGNVNAKDVYPKDRYHGD